MYTKRTILVITIMLILIGCQNQGEKQSVLENPLCAPPCWKNISPGKTTRHEFLESMKSLAYLDQESLHDYQAPWQGFDDLIRGTLHIDPKTVTYFDAFLLNDRIAIMNFQGAWDLTIGQAIDKLGEPTDILIVRHGSDIFVELLMPANGIAFGYSSIGAPSWRYSRIEPNIKVTLINFYDPEVYQQMLDAGLLSFGILDAEETRSRIQTWKGYGNIDELYTQK